MKFATLGTGGIGGFLGLKLSQGGFKVATIARGRHLGVIKDRGLSLISNGHEHTVKPWMATDNAESVGPVDVIFLGVKGDNLKDAAEKCKPMLQDHTIVIPFLNGVEASSIISNILNPRNVGNGVAYISATISSPGTITQTGPNQKFLIAETDNKLTKRITTLRQILNKCNISSPPTKDIQIDLWSKFIFFSALSGITAAARCNIGDILDNPELSKLFKDVIAEAAELARASNISVDIQVETNTWNFIQNLPREMRASTAIDLEKGNPLEINWTIGAVSRMSEALGITAPISGAIYSLLTPFKNGCSTETNSEDLLHG